METSLVKAVVESLEALFGHEVGSFSFYVLLGGSLAGWIVVARLLMGMLSTDRGIFAALLACLISFALGVLAFGALELYVAPQVEGEWAPFWLPMVGTILVVILSALFLGKRILKMSTGGTFFVYLAATGAAVCAFYLATVSLGLVESGSGQVEEREQRIQRELDSAR